MRCTNVSGRRGHRVRAPRRAEPDGRTRCRADDRRGRGRGHHAHVPRGRTGSWRPRSARWRRPPGADQRRVRPAATRAVDDRSTRDHQSSRRTRRTPDGTLRAARRRGTTRRLHRAEVLRRQLAKRLAALPRSTSWSLDLRTHRRAAPRRAASCPSRRRTGAVRRRWLERRRHREHLSDAAVAPTSPGPRPPGRAARASSPAAREWSGANMTPNVKVNIEARVGKRQRFGVSDPEVDREPCLRRLRSRSAPERSRTPTIRTATGCAELSPCRTPRPAAACPPPDRRPRRSRRGRRRSSPRHAQRGAAPDERAFLQLLERHLCLLLDDAGKYGV